MCVCVCSLFSCSVLKLHNMICFSFFYNLFQTPSIKFWNIPNPTNRTKHNKTTYYSITLVSISELTPNDLSFLMHYILKLTFFSTELMFPFQFSLILKKHPSTSNVYPLHCLSFNVDGASLILPKISAHLFCCGNIQIKVISITPVH